MHLPEISRRTFFALVQAPRWPVGVLLTGQSNAGIFQADGALALLNEGLAALLGGTPATFDAGVPGRAPMPGYGMPSGVIREPAAYTTIGSVPLWQANNPRGFLLHRLEADPGQWPRGVAGGALGRFIRSVMTAEDRARCRGILWLHTEDDSRNLEDSPAGATQHSLAIKRHLALIRADFGRPATGPEALPAFGWLPVPFGNSRAGHIALRRALAGTIADGKANFSLALPQTANVELRGGGTDIYHFEAADFRAMARRAAYAIARVCGATLRWPAQGPRITEVIANDPFTTHLLISHDRGTELKMNGAAGTGVGWSVMDAGEPRAVHSLQLGGPALLILRHQGASSRREIGYCLFGERIGRGNAITDNWSEKRQVPPGLGPEWSIDFPLQGTLNPFLTE